MTNQDLDRKYVRDSTESKKLAECPKCGSKKVTSCPGGSKLKAVPGIWWKCEECKHEW